MDIDGSTPLWCRHQYLCKYQKQEIKETHVATIPVYGTESSPYVQRFL